MTYREYFEEHENENLSWCKPYLDKSEEYCIVMHDGEVNGVVTPQMEAIRGWSGTQDIEDAVADIAKHINPDYDCYSGWDDLHIALDAMHEWGCASCPYKEECDAMGEEMGETDWRGE